MTPYFGSIPFPAASFCWGEVAQLAVARATPETAMSRRARRAGRGSVVRTIVGFTKLYA
ncbi:hypothetical protein ACU4GA_25900 [Methylobacterium oryzae CBMB20]|nr:hypothetical protein AU375_04397 [Methylobacterium radiotolerans]